MEANLNDAAGADIDEFDVPSIGLNGRPDEIDDILHFLAHGGRIQRGGSHKNIIRGDGAGWQTSRHSARR